MCAARMRYRFLQGQVSNDVMLLPDRGSLLAGLHNAQGRVLAAAATAACGEGPRTCCPACRALGDGAAAAWKVRAARQGQHQRRQRQLARVRSNRPRCSGRGQYAHLHADGCGGLAPAHRCAAQRTTAPQTEPTTRESWRLADIEAGLPEVLAATSGNFVAQMLNLDLVDAVSLTKGCYTGQEVVARAHYRGQVKRRMQRFFTESSVLLTPGARVQPQRWTQCTDRRGGTRRGGWTAVPRRHAGCAAARRCCRAYRGCHGTDWVRCHAVAVFAAPLASRNHRDCQPDPTARPCLAPTATPPQDG